MSNNQNSARILKDILTKADKVLGCLGVHNFEDTRFTLLCHDVETEWPDALSWFVLKTVSELESYGIFVSVDPIDNRRAFWLDRDDRDEHQKLISGR